MISVTQVLDFFTEPELLAWYLREGKAKCERISQEAKRIGEVVDREIQHDLKGLSLDTYATLSQTEQTAVSMCLHAWQQFKEKHPLFVSTVTGIQTELMDGELIGHPDLEITEPHRWGVVDIKTSKTIQPKHWTQVAAYWWLKGGRPPVKSPFPSFVAILRLDKLTGQYHETSDYQEITDIETLRYEVEVFQAYLTAYQHGQRVRERWRELREREVLDVA